MTGLLEGRGAPQVPPLRLAPVGMTNLEVVPWLGFVAD
jgi:hypothetical protein